MPIETTIREPLFAVVPQRVARSEIPPKIVDMGDEQTNAETSLWPWEGTKVPFGSFRGRFLRVLSLQPYMCP